jgi:hypothetical protein
LWSASWLVRLPNLAVTGAHTAVIAAKAAIHVSVHATDWFKQPPGVPAWIPTFVGMTAVWCVEFFVKDELSKATPGTGCSKVVGCCTQEEAVPKKRQYPSKTEAVPKQYPKSAAQAVLAAVFSYFNFLKKSS